MSPYKNNYKKGGDKVETSPNNRAKCKCCRRPILKGTTRAGIETYNDYYHRYIVVYYHEDCLPQSLRSRLGGSIGINDALAHQNKRQVEKDTLIQKRSDLRESLRKLRMRFAHRIGGDDFPLYKIFNNKTLDELVTRMPTNRAAFMLVPGCKEKRYNNFGEPIITVIKYYKRKYARAEQQAQAAASGADSAEEFGDDLVVVGETLSVHELVSRRFAQAEANGETIEI